MEGSKVNESSSFFYVCNEIIIILVVTKQVELMTFSNIRIETWSARGGETIKSDETGFGSYSCCVGSMVAATTLITIHC